MTWTWVLTVFSVLLAAQTVAELWLGALNRRNVLAHAGTVPEAAEGVMDAETYRKSVQYTLAKNQFGQWQTLYDAAWLFAWLGLGLLPPVFHWFWEGFGASVWGGAALLCAVGAVLSAPGLPWDWWGQFRLEERFGFNKTTPRLWIADKLKAVGLGLFIGYPLLCLVLWFFTWQPRWWWLWAWAALFVVQMIFMVLAPRVILPLFNKLTPLPEGELRTRLLALAERAGFHCTAIEVIDGSKRSTHANAFFTGFGRFRRIVLFDTLIEQLTPHELEAVLAHEIGHYRLGHIPKLLAVSALTSLAGFAALGWLAGQEWFYTGFRFDPAAEMPAALLLFAMTSGLATFWLHPVSNFWSRKYEYQADAFAREALGGSAAMIHALRKLHAKNLSNLTPHPAFSFFHYSHPTLVERETALRAA